MTGLNVTPAPTDVKRFIPPDRYSLILGRYALDGMIKPPDDHDVPLKDTVPQAIAYRMLVNGGLALAHNNYVIRISNWLSLWSEMLGNARLYYIPQILQIGGTLQGMTLSFSDGNANIYKLMSGQKIASIATFTEDGIRKASDYRNDNKPGSYYTVTADWDGYKRRYWVIDAMAMDGEVR